MEADNARRMQQQRATPPAEDGSAVGIVPRGRPANVANNRLPVIRGATPPPGGRAPLRGERRPRSGRRPNVDAPGEQRGSQSPPRRGLGVGDEQPPRFGDGEGGAGQKVLEQEVQHLTHQVQELLVGLHGRVLMLEQDLGGARRDKDLLQERLQGLELDNVALRAEVKMLAPGEKVANLERDVAQKLHAHLEHVTSVESERVAAALQRMHQMQLDAQEEHRKGELAQQAIQQQQQVISTLEERLRVVESAETVSLQQQAQEHEARQLHGAHMEVRVHELEAALRQLTVKGEQVVRDTGDAMKSMVENSSASILSQLQYNVSALTTQMKAVEQELLQRGSDIAHRTEEEGQQRVRSLAELEKTMSAQLQRIQAEVDDVRDSRLALETATREGDEHVLAHVRAALATAEEAAATSTARMDTAMQRLRTECDENIARQVAAAEEARSFLEEVVRAEIRGRLQGQETLARRIMEMEEVARGEEGREKEHKEAFTLLKLLQAKAKAHSKSLRMLGAELDSAKRAAKTGEEDLSSQIRACMQGLKEAEERAEKDLAIQAQAARDERAIIVTRIDALEEGRGEILDKISREVDANRLADNERAKDVTERIEGLQRAVDACVDMCQSDLRDLHESHHALEHRLDREAEGLEGLLDRTARDLTRSLDAKLQGSMKEAVDSLATELQAEIGGLREQQIRADGEYKEQRQRIETQRQALEHKIRAAQHQVEEAEARSNLSLKRIKDEVQTNGQSYTARFDALDEQLHAARALAGQHKTESVERDTLLDGKMRRLEQELLFSGGAGQAQSALRLLDVPQPFDVLAPSPSPRPFEGEGPQKKSGAAGETSGGGGTRTLAGGPGGLIGNMQNEMEEFRKRVLDEFQEIRQQIAEGGERMSDTRRKLGEAEGRLTSRTDTVWEETRQQWEAVSKRLYEEHNALQEQLAVQRKVEQDHRDELDAAIKAEADARASATEAAQRALEEAQFEIDKRMQGVDGVEAHIGEARRAAQEAIAELRQQLADEEASRLELDHKVSTQIGETRHEMEQTEERNRALVLEKDAIAAKREEALLDALHRVKSGVEGLVERAEAMEQAQLKHAKDLSARHAEMQSALNAAARHTVAIADAHRRDIDRVCRESECATLLSELVERTAAGALEERMAADAARSVKRVDENLAALQTEMVSKVIPKSVKDEVGELMTLKLLPLQYSVTDLSHEVKDIETQAETFHDKVTNKLELIESSLDEHKDEHLKHTHNAEKTATEISRLDAAQADQRAAHGARLDGAEEDVAQATSAAVLENILRALELQEEKRAQQAAAKELHDKLAVLETVNSSKIEAVMKAQADGVSELQIVQKQLQAVEAKLQAVEEITTHLSEEMVDDSTEKEVEGLRSEVEALASRVKKVHDTQEEIMHTLAGGISPDGREARSAAEEQAREERALLGGGDMPTINEDAEEVATPKNTGDISGGTSQSLPSQGSGNETGGAVAVDGGEPGGEPGGESQSTLGDSEASAAHSSDGVTSSHAAVEAEAPAAPATQEPPAFEAPGVADDAPHESQTGGESAVEPGAEVPAAAAGDGEGEQGKSAAEASPDEQAERGS